MGIVDDVVFQFLTVSYETVHSAWCRLLTRLAHDGLPEHVQQSAFAQATHARRQLVVAAAAEKTSAR